MNKLIHYPDILLKILEHVDLNTFLSLYGTCVALHNLIITYQATLTVTVAQNTFPEEILRILERIHDEQHKDGYIQTAMTMVQVPCADIVSAGCVIWSPDSWLSWPWIATGT